MTRAPRGAPTVVKLGGSVITNKGVAFSYKEKVARSLGRAMASSGVPVVVVHGGGSFGHTVAGAFGLSSSRSSPSPQGVTETRDAMLRLNSKVCASLLEAGLHPYPFSPFTLLDREGGPAFIARLLKSGATPVTFGDVVHDGKGFRILSGDTICVELAEMLGARRCVMALDVAGLLDEGGEVVKVLSEGRWSKLSSTRPDATGGIALKVEEAQRMASSGTEVRFVSGLRPDEFARALLGRRFHGTLFKPSGGRFSPRFQRPSE